MNTGERVIPKRLSQSERERLRREARLARPYPDDWTDWDTKYALMCAEKWEQHARWLLKHKRVDLGAVDEALAAAEAREIARKAPNERRRQNPGAEPLK
jgi:hypothetical protein